jgi:hypothetical protein
MFAPCCMRADGRGSERNMTTYLVRLHGKVLRDLKLVEWQSGVSWCCGEKLEMTAFKVCHQSRDGLSRAH